MAALPTQALVNAGTAPTFAAPTASDTAEVGKGVFAVYRNTHASESATVTVVVPGQTSYGQDTPDVIYTVAAESECWIPLTHLAYRDAESGRVTITTSGGTLEAAIVKVI